MGKVHNLTNIQELDKLVSITKDTYYLIFFGAKWCSPCQNIKPRINDMSCNYNIVFLYVDIDNDDSNNTIKISDYFNIKRLPTFILIKSKQANLPSAKNISSIILKRIEGPDLSCLIHLLNNIHYESNSKKLDSSHKEIDRFEPPNINYTREIGYKNDLDDNIYEKVIDEKNNEILSNDKTNLNFSLLD
jgi:thiol-disulfide isomerase/thioredoxin